jgi:hypothetical protein
VVDSKWLQYLSDIICGSLKVVRSVAAGTGALVHCSDGWDRTPQITSLSSVILDPYYRTALGFFILIEKEWCSMGHKFADRLNNSIKTDQEESPVFLQWLDCVWQLWRQCPPAFEFNEVMLLHLADQVYCGRWLHFTHDCYYDVEAWLATPQATPPSFASAFLDLSSHSQSPTEAMNGMELKQHFRNNKYAPQFCDGALFVSGHQRSLQIWPYHFRWVSGSLRCHMHPDFVTAELPVPSYLMTVPAASIAHTDAMELLDQMLPGSPGAPASELNDDWLKETTSNGSFFWRHKVTNEVRCVPSAMESGAAAAPVSFARLPFKSAPSACTLWCDTVCSRCPGRTILRATSVSCQYLPPPPWSFSLHLILLQLLETLHENPEPQTSLPRVRPPRLQYLLIVMPRCTPAAPLHSSLILLFRKRINEQRACNQCHDQHLRSQSGLDR